ncbi:MAG: NAD(P)H-dependent oxidoreductase [Desulfobacterales bacterium]
MKRVLGLVGSYRPMGNTELLVKEIMNNAGEDCEKVLIRLTDLDIKPCRGCMACVFKGTHCRIKDDLYWLLKEVTLSDAVVVGAPCYILGAAGIIKMIQDRLIDQTLFAKDQKRSTRTCVSAIAAGQEPMIGYSPANVSRLAATFGEYRGHTTSIGQGQGECLMKPEQLAECKRLGTLLFAPDYELDFPDNECPLCHTDIFQIQEDGTARCATCQSLGKVVVDNGRFTVTFDEETYIDHEGHRLHMQRIMDSGPRFQQTKDQLGEIRNRYKRMKWWIHTPETKGPAVLEV